jgi:molecular chaperone GrpE (heat shock protein)
MKKDRKDAAAEAEGAADTAPFGADGQAEEAATQHSAGAVVEPAEGHIRRLEEELEKLKDQYLRLAADMDNFRKRTAKERTETWARAQADVVSNVLDALDDLGRVAHLDPSRTNAQDILVGVEMVERKFLKALESAGLDGWETWARCSIRIGTRRSLPSQPLAPVRIIPSLPCSSPGTALEVHCCALPGYRSRCGKGRNRRN